MHEGGGPQVGEVTCGGLPHLTCKRDQIKMRDDMDRRVTPGGYSHTLPIRVCAAQRGRDFEAPDLERGIHFRGVF